jgi:hypothetical protein
MPMNQLIGAQAHPCILKVEQQTRLKL